MSTVAAASPTIFRRRYAPFDIWIEQEAHFDLGANREMEEGLSIKPILDKLAAERKS